MAHVLTAKTRETHLSFGTGSPIKVGRPQVCVGRLPVWSVWGVRVPGPSGRGVRRVRNDLQWNDPPPLITQSMHDTLKLSSVRINSMIVCIGTIAGIARNRRDDVGSNDL